MINSAILGICILVGCIFIYKGCDKLSNGINISFIQRYSEEDRQLLQDLYDKEGDLKEEQAKAIGEVLEEFNSIMLDEEVSSNG